VFIVLGAAAAAPIELNELLKHHHACPQQDDVLCGLLEELVGFHSLFFSVGCCRNEVLQSLKLL